MKAWLVDAVTLGVFFGVVKWLLIGGGIPDAIVGGAFVGVAMATIFAWQKVPSLGRRRFAKPS
jgi:hypothetical protein